METITLTPEGSVTLPESVRQQLGLQGEARLNVEVRGGEIVLSRFPDWRQFRGMYKGSGLFDSFMAMKKEEIGREDSGS
jgi:bifunctional DNA-binding transcriptional regulator/antitoxin component of YhaV-PrlF toxin-antitoxin module